MNQIPTRIKYYNLQRPIGQGGMSTVHLAIDTRLNRQVALKILPINLSRTERAYKRFEEEARILSNLHHPAIVEIYDFDRLADGRPYIVMPYLAGGSLEGLIKQRHGFSLKQVCDIVVPIAEALDIVHKKNIFHRDIKPANILFDEHFNPYLADFGIAKQPDVDQNLTRQGHLIGTPAYMSPEQAKGVADIDRRTDVYSLSVVTFELMTGRVPYFAENGFTQANMHIKEPIPRPTKFNRKLPAECDTIIANGMAKDRDQRYGYASELAHYLYQAQKGGKIKTPRPQERIKTPPPNRKPQQRVGPSLVLMFTLVIVALLAIGSVFFWYSLQPATIPSSPAALTAATPTIVTANASARSFTRATATPAPLPDLEATAEASRTLVHSNSGSLRHPANDTFITSSYADVAVRDFDVSVVFRTPYDVSQGPWDIGLLFRDTGSNNQYRLSLSSDGIWQLIDRREDDIQQIQAGELTSFNINGSQRTNTIRVVAIGDVGVLSVNNKEISYLDLSSRSNSGDIAVATGLFSGHKITGETTIYSTFRVWELR